SKPDEVKTAVRTALDAGYRLIDTAYNYLNEEAIGEVLDETFKVGKLKREELFICTKLANIYTRPSDVARSMSESLRKLKLSYVDLYLIHAPMTLRSKPDEVKTAVRTALDAGYRLIDTAYNYLNEEAIGEVLDETFKVGKLKREELFICTKLANIYTRPSDVARSMSESLRKLKLSYVDLYLIHAPMTLRGLQGKVPSVYVSACCWGITDRSDVPVLLNDPVIAKLATKYNKTPAQVLLRNLLQRNTIVIPKSVTPSRIQQNGNVFDFQLSPEDMTVIAGIDNGERLIQYPAMATFYDYPFNSPL
ncbi:alcohol dehydrogenase [NADP(+)]-like, partial [Mizuhopecten yessoensis]|uniref:alcohol dehydrogenase [NADP(+)]-like n=1 Tax=Mizuhopecten yessoensis TaxID=6573 RepID=UPI000B45C526